MLQRKIVCLVAVGLVLIVAQDAGAWPRHHPRRRTCAPQSQAPPTASAAAVSPEVEAILQQLRLRLPNKTDNEIIQVIRGYFPSDKSAEVDGLPWFAERLHSAKTQKEAVDAIQKSAGLVFYDYQIGASGVVVRNSGPSGPMALRSLLGDDFFAVVIEATLGNGGIEQIGKLTHLRRLNISVPINDADLIHVEGLTELRELDLGGTAISDAGLEHLRFLKQLRYLGIWGTKVSDAGVKKLQQALPKCKITR